MQYDRRLKLSSIPLQSRKQKTERVRRERINSALDELKSMVVKGDEKVCIFLQGEWPSGLYSLRQVTEVKLGRVRSYSGWVTTET